MIRNIEKILFLKIQISKKYQIDLIAFIWFSLAIVALLSEILRGLGSIDNFLIFRGVFYHVVNKTNLFAFYPSEYNSYNNYGPSFSLIIAPFAVLPIYIGCFIWGIANAFLLFIAIKILPLDRKSILIIYWICCIEMMTSIHSVQFNSMFTAFIIFAFIFVRQGKDWIATLFIALTILSKIYGVAGLVFFFFSQNKPQFISSLLVWLCFFFFIPMAYSSPEYIIKTYEEWYFQLIKRSAQNISDSLVAGGTDISLPGMIRRIFKYFGSIDLYLILVGAILILLPIFSKKISSAKNMDLKYLALALISIVIFSPASESPTYIIAVTGCAIWFVTLGLPVSIYERIILVLVFLLTILSPTDIVPATIRKEFIVKFALKALPSLIIWCHLIISIWKQRLSLNIIDEK